MALFAALLVFALPAFAVQPDEILADPALESRARALSGDLRCLVCQNQSIDDSDAPLAKDLRVLIREHLVKGDTDAQVMDHIVSRYGEYVLLRPRFNSSTWILWSAPFVVLLLGAAALFRRRNSAVNAGEQPLNDDEKVALKRLK